MTIDQFQQCMTTYGEALSSFTYLKENHDLSQNTDVDEVALRYAFFGCFHTQETIDALTTILDNIKKLPT